MGLNICLLWTIFCYLIMLTISEKIATLKHWNQHWNIENIESNSMLKCWKTLTSHWVSMFIFLTSKTLKTLNRYQCQCRCRPLDYIYTVTHEQTLIHPYTSNATFQPGKSILRFFLFSSNLGMQLQTWLNAFQVQNYKMWLKNISFVTFFDGSLRVLYYKTRESVDANMLFDLQQQILTSRHRDT